MATSTTKAGSSSSKSATQDKSKSGAGKSTPKTDTTMSPEQEQIRSLTAASNAISQASGKVSAEQVKGWVTLFKPGNPVYEELRKLPLAQAKRYATGDERIPRDFRAGIKPEYQKLGSSFTWLKGIFRVFVAYEEMRAKAEGKAKRASRKTSAKKATAKS